MSGYQFFDAHDRHMDVRQTQGQVGIGFIFDDKEAETMAKKVIETERNNTTFLDTYAWVLFKRGKTREAAKIMEKIIASGEKDDAEWYEHYGYILKKMGKCREAVEKWEKALYIDNSKSKLKEEITNCKGKN